MLEGHSPPHIGRNEGREGRRMVGAVPPNGRGAPLGRTTMWRKEDLVGSCTALNTIPGENVRHCKQASKTRRHMGACNGAHMCE